MNEEKIEELKRLLYTDTLTQYGKRKLINYYEKLIEKLQKENEDKTKKIENQKNELATLNNKQKDFNKLQNTLNSYEGQFRRQEKEIKVLKAINDKYIIHLTDEQYKTAIELAQNDINQQWIQKVKEEYRKHYREEKHTRIKSDGTEEIYYTTEEYWTWDYVEEEKIHVDKFNFLGVDFDYDTIEFYNQSYNTTKEVEYHIRYEYYTIPSEFEGTLFTYINNNAITQNKFSINKTINEIVKSKEDDVNFINAIFWITWIIFITLIDFGYVYLENNYLED